MTMSKAKRDRAHHELGWVDSPEGMRESGPKKVVRVFLTDKDDNWLMRFNGPQNGEDSFLWAPTASGEWHAGEDLNAKAKELIKAGTGKTIELQFIGESMENANQQMTHAYLFVGKAKEIPAKTKEGDTFSFLTADQLDDFFHAGRMYTGWPFNEKVLRQHQLPKK